MDEEFVPGVEYVRRREIVDVDVPVTIERRRNQQARPVVEQDVPGLMEGTNVGDCLLELGLLGRGHVEDLADVLLAARFDFEKDAQLADRSDSRALPWRTDGMAVITRWTHDDCFLSVAQPGMSLLSFDLVCADNATALRRAPRHGALGRVAACGEPTSLAV